MTAKVIDFCAAHRQRLIAKAWEATDWTVVDAELANDPQWKEYVREQRIYRGLERARRRP